MAITQVTNDVLLDGSVVYSKLPNGGIELGSRNRIINGGCAIDQRNFGAAQNVTVSNTYFIDRFSIASLAAVTGTLTVQRIAPGSPGGPRYAMRLARTAGTYTSALTLNQVIETANCYDLAGSPVTISFMARKGPSYTAGLTVYLITGTGVDEGVNGATGGSWTGYANAGFLSPSLTTSWQTFSFTLTPGASVQEMSVNFNTGNFSGTGAAGDYIDITNVQLERGTVATPFEYRHNGVELALCQRYYNQSYSYGVLPGTVTIAGQYRVVGNGSAGAFNIQFPVEMRAVPTVVAYSPATGTSGVYSNVGSNQAPLAYEFSTRGGNINGTMTTGSYGATHYTAAAEL